VQERVLTNDERVLDAAVTLIDEAGWGGFHPAGVALTAGLSKRAVLERAQDRDTLAAATWQRRAWPVLEEALAAVLDAGGAGTSPDDVANPGARASSLALQEAVKPLLRPSPTLAVAIELILMAQYQRGLQAAVRQTLGTRAEELLSGEQRGDSGTLMGQRGFLHMLVGGLLIVALRRRHMPVPNLESYLESLAAALRASPIPVRLPADDAPHMDGAPPFDTGDRSLDRLLQATLVLVGERGFEDASIDAICRASGVSQGFLFGRYPSKRELFGDAVRRQQSEAYATNNAFLAGLAERYGPGIAEAVIVREVQRPERVPQNTIFLEQVRMAWHDPDLRDAQEREIEAAFAHEPRPRTKAERDAAYAQHHTASALGLGASLLPLIYPGAHLLPYDVVTVPLLG
jgi:AcrR family transcriptional regulator